MARTVNYIALLCAVDYNTLHQRNQASQYKATRCRLHHCVETSSKWFAFAVDYISISKTSSQSVRTSCRLHLSASKTSTPLCNDIIVYSALLVFATTLWVTLLYITPNYPCVVTLITLPSNYTMAMCWA